jgi:hypothetical protein
MKLYSINLDRISQQLLNMIDRLLSMLFLYHLTNVVF